MKNPVILEVAVIAAASIAWASCAGSSPDPFESGRVPPPSMHAAGPASVSSIPLAPPYEKMGSFDQMLEGTDASAAEARSAARDILLASFDTLTKWPPAERMPEGVDPARIMEIGGNPGLGVRSLHARGITGQGVRIAVLDGTLLVDHEEYAAVLESYEEVGVHPEKEAEMHGPAVASIAVGRTCGVAPGARLRYIACLASDWNERDHGSRLINYARAIDRILLDDAGLPPESRVRVVSISSGWHFPQKGALDLNAAVARAKKAGVFVVSSNLEPTFGFRFMGLSREPLADPDDFASYTGPGSWLADRFFSDPRRSAKFFDGRLYVPMDSRSYASPRGPQVYSFGRVGGWSWCSPWIAGLYALACQVDPGMTPARFWKAALATARRVPTERNGVERAIDAVVDPAALVAALER